MATKKQTPKPAKRPTPAPDAEPQLSRFQAFETRRMHRRELKGAPYNPRILSDAARKNLKRNLDSDHGGVGLLGPVTWNEVTGLLVGGHMRLKIIDALEGSDDYLIDVAVVRLTEKQEREQNIALNSDRMAAEWDLDLLGALLKTPDLDLEATGFTVTDIQLTFDDPELGSLFAPNAATKDLLADVQAMQDDGKPPSKSKARAGASGAGGDDSEGEGDGDPDGEPKGPREIMKETRARNVEAFADDDTETFAVVMFSSRPEKEAFMTHCGGDASYRYIDGSLVLGKMGEQIAAAVRAARPKPPEPVPAKPSKATKPKPKKAGK